jgi:hypothetical protein
MTCPQSLNINMFANVTEIDSAAKPGCSTQLESNDSCKVKQYFDVKKLGLNV